MPTKSSRSATSNATTRFNAVKLELAIVLGLVLGVVIVIARIDAGHWVEMGLLAVTGFGCGGWLAYRTHATLVRSDQGD